MTRSTLLGVMAGGGLALLVPAGFLGCGPRLEFRQAMKLKEQGIYPQALRAFESFAAKYPDDPRACEAFYQAGLLYRESLGRFQEARRLLEEAARRPKDAGCVSKAKRELVRTPDYFPWRGNRIWFFGDSQTGGKNMRTKLYFEVSGSTSSDRAVLVQEIFAGKTHFQTLRRAYELAEWELREYASPQDSVYAVILRYPFVPGQSWRTRRSGQGVRFSIEESAAAVQVRAGRYEGCLKVREEIEGAGGSWKYDYYAPGVGKVLTTVAGPSYENRNAELIEFQAGGAD
ncbi:MAG: tetratricopeptide repeat protein [Elusimicrobia bacterium]|nr:tetratricopeptide repeat protein [Elusimicrobiota bacterium]